MVRSALLASMTDGEKSVRRLVNDANLRLAWLLLPHQSIGEEGPNLDNQLFEGPLDPPIYAGGIHLREPSDDIPARRMASDAEVRGKGKELATEQME